MVTRRLGNCAPSPPSLRPWAGLYKIGLFFTSLFLQCLMTAWKGKAAVKIGMQYGKLKTDSRFYKPPK